MNKNLFYWITIMVVAIVGVGFVSCGGDDNDNQSGDNQNEIIQNLMSHKWTGSSTDYDEYSYGVALYTQTWTVYFTSNHEGVMHIRIVDRDSSLGTSRSEEHIDFSYYVEGNKIHLYGGSNFFFDYFGDFMTEGDNVFESSQMTSSDYTYLQEHKGGYHGTEGKIDTEVFIINENEILMGVNNLGNGWYSYVLQFGFGVNSDDAYKKGITQIKLTIWADNGCFDLNYKTSDYGKKKTYTLYLSSSEREWYDWIYIQSKDTKITFNYELEYYNSKDGQWYDIQSRKLTFNANGSGSGTSGSDDNQGSGSYTGTVQGHEYVDLGLSVKWATCNVGASNPENKGWYYQWGETTSSSIPDYWAGYQCWESYEFYDTNTQTCKNIGNNISGTKYDAARKNWGSKWRMATAEEWDELIDKCSWKHTTINGTEGFLGTGKNGQTIFFPDAGRKEGVHSTDGGHYWSADIDSYDIDDAKFVLFRSTSYKPQLKEWSRWAAMSIRAVTE